MNKLKERLSQLKENIEVCEERKKDAEGSLIQAKARLEMIESEKASFRRRMHLLRQDLDKTNERLRKKQMELDGLECKTAEDELVVRELEHQEVDGDERLESLNDKVKIEKTQAEDYDFQWREASRKVHILQQDVERAENRYEASALKAEESMEILEKLGKSIKLLEERESNACDLETENEEKFVFLKSQEKEALVRAEDVERDAVRLKRVVEGLWLDINNWKNKKEDIIAEINSVSSLADDI